MALISLMALAVESTADDVVFKYNGKTKDVTGNVLAKDSLGTILLEGRDGARYFIPRSDQIEWEKSPGKVAPFNKQQLRKYLEKQLGGRYRFEATGNYMIAYTCDPEYAREAGRLFHRALSIFTNYFRRAGFDIKNPEQPMIAIISGSREEYLELVREDLGPLASQTAGVYVPNSNRMYMFNAIGGKTGAMLRQFAQHNARGAQEALFLLREQNISVIIHEAVHQIAFNTGFHNRNSRHPLWMVEGMATFWESPDLDAKGGWSGKGRINRERLERFASILPTLDGAMLERLVTDDMMLRDGKTANDGYALSWALTYYLAKTKTQSYFKYIRLLNARPPLTEVNADGRLNDFRKAFGKNPEDLIPEFRRYMSMILTRRQDV